MTMRSHLRISRGGQVSVPAEIRKRWGTATVLAEDHGDSLVLRPAPDDPIDSVVGIFADEIKRLPSEEAMRQYREEEIEAEQRKWGGSAGPA
jgi:bifunctional DNA-binding transcriptional regulator/antitoxin component of YhaV-PrlF toxin-antitoxin module